MSDWVFLNKHRIDYGPLKADPAHGCNGCFEFNVGTYPLRVIASDGTYMNIGWKHVSVSIRKSRKPPPWEVMCAVKDLFWEPEETAIQFHPPHSSYVNNHPGCLHLWQYLNGPFPLPPTQLVGAKSIGVLPEKRPSLEQIVDILQKTRAESKQMEKDLGWTRKSDTK